jgi:hypothetical protein
MDPLMIPSPEYALRDLAEKNADHRKAEGSEEVSEYRCRKHAVKRYQKRIDMVKHGSCPHHGGLSSISKLFKKSNDLSH